MWGFQARWPPQPSPGSESCEQAQFLQIPAEGVRRRRLPLDQDQTKQEFLLGLYPAPPPQAKRRGERGRGALKARDSQALCLDPRTLLLCGFPSGEAVCLG